MPPKVDYLMHGLNAQNIANYKSNTNTNGDDTSTGNQMQVTHSILSLVLLGTTREFHIERQQNQSSIDYVIGKRMCIAFH